MTTVNQLLDITSLWNRGPIDSASKKRFFNIFRDLPYIIPKKLHSKVNCLMETEYITALFLESLEKSLQELVENINEECIEEDFVRPFGKTYHLSQTNNKKKLEYAYNLNRKWAIIDPNYYHYVSVVYIGILCPKNPLTFNDLILKIGFSDRFLGRLPELERDYDCDFILLGLRKGLTQIDEKQLHKELKEEFPNLIVDMNINGQDKTELYAFEECIHQKFLNYKPFKERNMEINEKTKQNINEHFERDAEFFQNAFKNLVNDEEQPKTKKRKLNTI